MEGKKRLHVPGPGTGGYARGTTPISRALATALSCAAQIISDASPHGNGRVAGRPFAGDSSGVIFHAGGKHLVTPPQVLWVAHHACTGSLNAVLRSQCMIFSSELQGSEICLSLNRCSPLAHCALCTRHRGTISLARMTPARQNDLLYRQWRCG